MRILADWDQDTWDGLKELCQHIWRLNPVDCVKFGASLYAAGYIVGAMCRTKPLMRWELMQAAEEAASHSPDPLGPWFLKAAKTTEGDRDGLSDLCMMLRDLSEVCAMRAYGQLRDDVDAEAVYHYARGQMIGAVKMAPQEALKREVG